MYKDWDRGELTLKVLHRTGGGEDHLCETPSGEKITVDLMSDGDMDKAGVAADDLVGKFVTVDYVYPCTFIGMSPRIAARTPDEGDAK